MALTDFLFGSQPAPNVTSTTSTDLPLWYQQYLQKLFQRGSEAVNEPYQTYGGPRIAPLSGKQQDAYSSIQSGIGSYAPTFQTAEDYATGAGGGFDQTEFDKYMNPYISGVTDQIAKLGTRNLTESILPGIQDQFIAAGQAGGSRGQEFSSRAVRDTQEAVLAEQGRALASGYGTALQGYGAGQDRTLSAAKGLGELGTSQQASDLRGAAALEAAGQAEQGQAQKNLDLGYGDFVDQRNYPRDQASYLSALIRGFPTGQTQTTTGPATQSQLAPSVLGQVAGAGVGGYGLYKLFQGLKKGGKVRKLPKNKKPVRGLGSFKKAA